jgi:hypothetical protein
MNNQKNETFVSYIQEEIGIRIESIKMELDKIHEKFLNDLELIKNDFIE